MEKATATESVYLYHHIAWKLMGVKISCFEEV